MRLHTTSVMSRKKRHEKSQRCDNSLGLTPNFRAVEVAANAMDRSITLFAQIESWILSQPYTRELSLYLDSLTKIWEAEFAGLTEQGGPL